MTLEPGEFERLRSMHDRLDLQEGEDIFLPLSRLLSIYVDATHRLYQAQRQFLGIRDRKVPYIIGVAGSVAVGKSATERVLQALLARRDSGFTDPRSYFHRFALPSEEEATATALAIWERTNPGKLEENILAARPRAALDPKKGADHVVESVALRRL